MRYTALMISVVFSAFVVAFVPAAAQSCTMPAAAVEMDGRYAGVSDCTEVETFSIDTPGAGPDRTCSTHFNQALNGAGVHAPRRHPTAEAARVPYRLLAPAG